MYNIATSGKIHTERASEKHALIRNTHTMQWENVLHSVQDQEHLEIEDYAYHSIYVLYMVRSIAEKGRYSPARIQANRVYK